MTIIDGDTLKEAYKNAGIRVFLCGFFNNGHHDSI
jgi:hypothetical protein